jgi:hypothetical protein
VDGPDDEFEVEFGGERMRVRRDRGGPALGPAGMVHCRSCKKQFESLV